MSVNVLHTGLVLIVIHVTPSGQVQTVLLLSVTLHAYMAHVLPQTSVLVRHIGMALRALFACMAGLDQHALWDRIASDVEVLARFVTHSDVSMDT
jgi:hypothetical protein